MDVTQQFHEAYPIHLHSHVIIDRIIYPDLPKSWKASPIITEITAPQAHLYPYLVQLDNLDSKQIVLLEKMILESKKRSGILLIKSHFDHDTLVYMLANTLIYSPQASENYLLRYYDHNVLLQLFKIIPSFKLFNKLKSLDIDYLTIHSQYDNITYIPNSKVNILGNNKTDILLQISNIGIINTSIKKLNKDMNISEYYKISYLLEEKISIARNKFSLININDIIVFITKCVLVHELYYTSPQIEKILNITSHYPGCYHDELALLSTNDWNSILKFCESKTSNN